MRRGALPLVRRLPLPRLTGEARTSVSTASGTGLFDPNGSLGRGDARGARADVTRLRRLGRPSPVSGRRSATAPARTSAPAAVTRGRAAVMVGTSGAARVVYDAATPTPRPGLFLYRLDARAVLRGRRALGRRQSARMARAHAARLRHAGLAERKPAAHGLTFLPFLGGERSLGWDADRRGSIAGLSFATTPTTSRRPRSKASATASRRARCDRRLESVVATGAALLANPPRCRCRQRARPPRASVRQSRRDRRAARRSSGWSGSVSRSWRPGHPGRRAAP